MAAAYSINLRTRVLADADAGLSSKDLAERYGVSRACVDALKQRRRETRAFAPLKQTKFRGRAWRPWTSTDWQRWLRRGRMPHRSAPGAPDVGRTDHALARPPSPGATVKNGLRGRAASSRRRR